MEVSLLFSVDNILVCCEASQDRMIYYFWLVVWFEACSRLKVNLEERELIPIRRVD